MPPSGPKPDARVLAGSGPGAAGSAILTSVHHDRPESITAVIVVAPGALRRAAWEALLMRQPEIGTVRTASTESEVTLLLPAAGPVTILLDAGAIEVDRLPELASMTNGAGVLCVVDDLQLARVVPLLRAGVIGCLAADATAGELVRALVAVGRGELVLPPSVAARALAELARPMDREARTIDALSEREREVVELLAQGLTNKDVAQRLFLSVRTVEAHLRNVYDKLGVRSRTEAVLWAIKQQGEGER